MCDKSYSVLATPLFYKQKKLKLLEVTKQIWLTRAFSSWTLSMFADRKDGAIHDGLYEADQPKEDE